VTDPLDAGSFGDAGPSLPQLDTIGRRAGAAARREAASSRLPPPLAASAHRGTRSVALGAAVAVVVLALAVAVVVSRHADHPTRQPTVTRSTADAFFPSAIPSRMQFQGYYSSADLTAAGRSPQLIATGLVQVFASPDQSDVLAVLAMAQPGESSDDWSTRHVPGAEVTMIAGREAIWSGSSSLRVRYPTHHLIYYFARGLTRAQVTRVAVAASYDLSHAPVIALDRLPADMRPAGALPIAAFDPDLFRYAGTSGPGSVLRWSGVSIVAQPATPSIMQVERTLLDAPTAVTVRGHAGLYGHILSGIGSSDRDLQLMWTEDGQLLDVIATGLNLRATEAIAESLRRVDLATLHRMVDERGGPFGPLPSPAVLKREGSEAERAGMSTYMEADTLVAQGTGGARWRVTVETDTAGSVGGRHVPAQTTIDVTRDGGENGAVGSASATLAPTELDTLSVDHYGSPTILTGRAGSAVVRVTAGPKPSQTMEPVLIDGQKYFAVLVSATAPITVIAYGADGKELSRQVIR
jgi:hypothetical protein